MVRSRLQEAWAWEEVTTMNWSIKQISPTFPYLLWLADSPRNKDCRPLLEIQFESLGNRFSWFWQNIVAIQNAKYSWWRSPGERIRKYGRNGCLAVRIMTENSIRLFACDFCEEDFAKSYIIQRIDSGDAARSYATVKLIPKQSDAYSNSREQEFINLRCFLGLAFLYPTRCWRLGRHCYSDSISRCNVAVLDLLPEQSEYWVIFRYCCASGRPGDNTTIAIMRNEDYNTLFRCVASRLWC